MRTRLLLAAATLGLGPALAAQAAPTSLSPGDSVFHVLNRLAYGPRPGDVDRLAGTGVWKWIEAQLDAGPTDERALREREGGFDILRIPPDELARHYASLMRERRREKQEGQETRDDPRGTGRTMGPDDPRRLGGELQQLVVFRATLADNQLREVMVDFWANHFNIFLGKGADRYLLPSYIEETIRPRALGRFEDLLIATAQSPAMLFYLDNVRSVAPGAEPPRPMNRLGRRRAIAGMMAEEERRMRARQRMPNGINENYARELMELHTLGVDGGYTQADVIDVARIFTGWSMVGPEKGAGFEFRDWAHDYGQKYVLGERFPKGHGEDEGIRLLRLLANHPSTMHHVSAELCTRFVRDDPPDGCVDDAVRAWKASGGDMREVLRAIFASPDFWAAANVRSKVKTPLEFVASAVRAVGGEPDTLPALARAVGRLGEPLYQQATPQGYPESQEEWVNSGALLNRMNFAMDLAAGKVPGVALNLEQVSPVTDNYGQLLDRIDAVILGGTMSSRTRQVILDQLQDVGDPERARAFAIGLALGGPEFQKQ